MKKFTAPRRAALPLILLTLGFLSGCAMTGINRGDLNLVSLDEEWQLGSQLENDLNRQFKPVGDSRVVQYVNEIGQRIVRQTELGNVPWEFHVVADPAINAFNVPGGHVYVNTGLIAAADNVSELAGVIAHEIAHGVSRHGTERLTKAYGANIAATLLLGQNQPVYEQVLAQIVGGGLFAKFSRDDEREADRLGVRYMHAAGYDPAGMAGMFEKLLVERKQRPGAVEQFFSSHPLTESRISDVRRQAQSLPKKSGLIAQDGELAGVQKRLR